MGKETGFCATCVPCPSKEVEEQLQQMCQLAYYDCITWCETLKPSEYSDYVLSQKYFDEFGSKCHKAVLVGKSSEINSQTPLTFLISESSTKSPRTSRAVAETVSGKALPAGEDKHQNSKLRVGLIIGTCITVSLVGVLVYIKRFLQQSNKGKLIKYTKRMLPFNK